MLLNRIMSDSPEHAFADAVGLAGSEAKLAKLAGYSQPAINKAKRLKRMSADMAIAIERATGIPRHRLAPEYWPPPVQEAA